MAKQKKAVIDQRIEKLKSLGYELVPNSQGWYHTIREVDRLVIDRRDIDYQTAEEWEVSLAKVEADHSKHLPITESEVIPNDPTPGADATGPGTTMVVTMDVEKDIATFDVNRAKIAEWEKEYAGLKFTTLQDVDTIKKIREGKKLAQKTRIAVTKREDFLKAPYIAGSKKIKAVADDYVFLLAKIEDPLDIQLDLIKEAEEADKIKKAAELEKEGTRRVDVLKEAGMKFDGQFYCIAERSMDYASIKAMTPEAFDDLVEKVKGDKKRLDDLQAEELKTLKKQRLEQRSKMLESIGMEYSGLGHFECGQLEGVKVLNACLTDEPDDKFMALFSSLSSRIAEAKKKVTEEADRKAKERLVAMRSKLVVAIGLKPVDSIPGVWVKGFYFENAVAKIHVLFNSVEALTDDEFDAVIESKEKEIEEAIAAAGKKAKEEAANKIIYKQRQDQLVAIGMWWEEANKWFTFTKHDATTKCSVAQGELTGKSPEAWEEVIKEVTELVATIKQQQQDMEDKRAKDKKDKEEQDAKDLITYQERQYKLVNLGLVIVGSEFIMKNEFGDVATIALAKVKAIDEDNWPRVMSEMTAAVDNVKKMTSDKRQAALDKLEALKPEIQKCEESINQVWDLIKDTSSSNFKDGEVGNIYGGFYTDIYKAVNLALGHLTKLKK